jgi:soluble P-type ATPase
MIYKIPGLGDLELDTLILDLNGTIAVDGSLLGGVKEGIKKLQDAGIEVVFFTGNTNNDAEKISSDLGIGWKLAKNAIEKAELALSMGSTNIVTIGNGSIDAELFKVAKLSILTIQAEGASKKAFDNCDILTTSIADALEILILPSRLIATLRS